MDNDFFYSSYVPENVFYDIVNDINNASMEVEALKELPLNDHEKILVFWACRNAINKNLTDSDVLEAFFGKKANYELMKLEDIVQGIFVHKFMTDAILKVLNYNDNKIFWNAFGLSVQRGNEFLEELRSSNCQNNVLKKLKSEIIAIDNIDKELIFNKILPQLYQNCLHKDAEDNLALITSYRIIAKIKDKYPRIVNRILEIEDYPMSLSSIFEISTSGDFIDKQIYNPKIVCDMIYPFKLLLDKEQLLYGFNFFINIDLEDKEKTSFIDTFKYNKYGYEVYNFYLDFCDKYGLNPGFSVDKPEEFFLNSYKVPQLKSLYHRYYPDVSENEAKQRTIECYSQIFKSLQKNKYLDKDCCLNEFLWAFGLTNEYPYCFVKIAFQTSKEKKANGAFLTLLKILGYEEDEIKEMRQERKNKPNLINQIFDLTLSRKTKESKDYYELLDFIKNSGLPVKE